MGLNFSIFNSASSRSYPRGLHYTGDPILNTCTVPFNTLSINFEGLCFICGCEAHLPVPVGSVTDFNSLSEVWTNAKAATIQETVTRKKFTYCAIEHCGIKNHSKISDQYSISVNIDESCNLACPSCRRSMINHTSGPLFEQRKAMVTHLVKLINEFDKPLYLTMCGNGDPLASLIMRPLVLDWIPKPSDTIQLFTNGLLMRKLLPDSKILPNIQDFKISVDAGSKEVYEVVRNPGKFEVLQENLTWLSEHAKGKKVNVRLMFTLSSMNATDIVNFAKMCNQFGFEGEITKLDNWGTFDNFQDKNVVENPNHPLYNTAIEQLKIVATMPKIILAPTIKSLL